MTLQGGQGQPEGVADMQLVQTDMQHSHEDSAANNLQQYGGYMVVGHPTDTAAAQDVHQMGQLPDGSHMVALYTDGQQELDSSHTGAVRWYGSYSSGTDHAALVSPAAGPGEQIWSGQAPLQETTMDKKQPPADVSRHDTPTSVFDIFNSLDISGTASAQAANQQQQHQHISGTHLLVCSNSARLQWANKGPDWPYGECVSRQELDAIQHCTALPCLPYNMATVRVVYSMTTCVATLCS